MQLHRARERGRHAPATTLEIDDARVLVVDDDERVARTLVETLRPHCLVDGVFGPFDALDYVERHHDLSVIVSDMRMPGMDGAALLEAVEAIRPDATRVVLTGYADADVAIAAINRGRIFRFLQKPCSPDVLLSCVRDAVGQNRLLTAQRELTEQTLTGATQALLDTLALAAPEAFARAQRITRRAEEIARTAEVADTWALRMGAMLSQLGAVVLPSSATKRLHQGLRLSDREQQMVRKAREQSLGVIEQVPRLERVHDVIRLARQRHDGRGAVEWGLAGEDIPIGARVLGIAEGLDPLEARGSPRTEAAEQLAAETGRYDPDILALLRSSGPVASPTASKVGLNDLRDGMVLAADVWAKDGNLLCGTGTKVTERLLERLRNWAERIGVDGPMLVEGEDDREGGEGEAAEQVQ